MTVAMSRVEPVGKEHYLTTSEVPSPVALKLAVSHNAE